MAQLWIYEGGEWAWLPLASSYVPFRRPGGREPWAALIEADGQWAVIASSAADVRVNGLPLDLGVRALDDRDELRINEDGDKRHFFFSSERETAVEPFPGAEREVICLRCRQPIEKDDPAVRCPGCGAWYHQSDRYPCFTYSTSCPRCGGETALGAGFRWTPEGSN